MRDDTRSRTGREKPSVRQHTEPEGCSWPSICRRDRPNGVELQGMPGQGLCAQRRGECDSARYLRRGGKTIRRKEFFDRKMRKLDDPRTMAVDDGNQTWTCREQLLFLILPSEVRVERRNLATSIRIKVECKDLRKLVNTKGSDCHGQALEQALDMTTGSFYESPSGRARRSRPRYRVVHLQSAEPSIGDKASASPADRIPIGTYMVDSERGSIGRSTATPYMPSAFSESVSMTSFLSSSRHLLSWAITSASDLIYLAISSLCPVSS